MGGEQYADKLSAQTEGSDRLLAKIKESLDPLISADTRESGSNHWLLVALRNTKAARAGLTRSLAARRAKEEEEVEERRPTRARKKTKQKKRASELTFLQQQVEENFCSGSP